jgi:hypothetical protein
MIDVPTKNSTIAGRRVFSSPGARKLNAANRIFFAVSK